MVTIRWVVASVAAGIVATLLTGLYNSTPEGLVGAIWYGLPFAWIRRVVVAPQYYPWRTDIVGLGLDAVFWAVLLGILWFLIARIRRRTTKIVTQS